MTQLNIWRIDYYGGNRDLIDELLPGLWLYWQLWCWRVDFISGNIEQDETSMFFQD